MAEDRDQRGTERSGLRPMLPRRDLRPVIELISEGFDEWQSWRGKSFLSLLRILSHAGPLLPMARLSSAYRQFCSALVWTEDGQVVGVVAGHPIGSDPRYWIFKNIVVSRSYQRRGIGRELQRGLIEKAISEGAEKAIVMVRVDNAASINLTAVDGFVPLTVRTEMTLKAPRASAPAIGSEDGLRPQKRGDRRQVYELVRAVTPAALRAFSPVTEDDSAQTLGDTLRSGLRNLLSGQRVHRFVLEEEDELAARLTVEASLWGEHRVEMTVHPSWRGQLEDVLVSTAINVLDRYPRESITVGVPAAHTEAIGVLRHYGFEETKRQVILGLDLARLRG